MLLKPEEVNDSFLSETWKRLNGLEEFCVEVFRTEVDSEKKELKTSNTILNSAVKCAQTNLPSDSMNPRWKRMI